MNEVDEKKKRLMNKTQADYGKENAREAYGKSIFGMGQNVAKEQDMLLTGCIENLWQGATMNIMTLFDFDCKEGTKGNGEALKNKMGGRAFERR
ncbi:hypothetical protein [Azotosporobacter soli]|uniref:hypothetical protein n=1 Tax=Azotosporobacter soli TaxID=3055040 RepID=UPI0031FE7EA5